MSTAFPAGRRGPTRPGARWREGVLIVARDECREGTMNDSLQPHAARSSSGSCPACKRRAVDRTALPSRWAAEYLFAASRTEDLRHAVVVARSSPARHGARQAKTCWSAIAASAVCRCSSATATRASTGELLTAAPAPSARDRPPLAQRGLAGLEFAGNIRVRGGAVVGKPAPTDVQWATPSCEPAYCRPRTSISRSRPTWRSATARAVSRASRGSSWRPPFALHAGRRNALLDEIARDAELRPPSTRSTTLRAAATSKSLARAAGRQAINELGLKGSRFGSRSERAHANFIVPIRPGADDIRRVAGEVARRVSRLGYVSRRVDPARLE